MCDNYTIPTYRLIQSIPVNFKQLSICFVPGIRRRRSTRVGLRISFKDSERLGCALGRHNLKMGKF